jgi:adenylosuccinate synthase
MAYIAEFLDVPVALISVGKERTQTIVCDEDLL